MTAWVFRGDGGVWSRPIETMDTPIELWPDEFADFPPLVEARAENKRLRIEIDGCGCPPPWDNCMHGEPLGHAVTRLSSENVRLHAENDRLRAERDRLFAIAADLTSCGCWNPCMGDDDPDDLTLIRRAIDVGGDR